MDVAKAKDLLKEMMSDDDVKTQPPPKRKKSRHVIIAPWDITYDHDGCIVCGGTKLTKSTYNLL